MSGDGGPLLGGGGFFGRGGFGPGPYGMGPGGPYGAWPGCGCASLFIIIGGMFLVCGGFLSLFENMFRGYGY